MTQRQIELIATAKKLYPAAENDFVAVDLYCQRVNVEARSIQNDVTKEETYYALCKAYRELKELMKIMPLPESYKKRLPIINERPVMAGGLI